MCQLCCNPAGEKSCCCFNLAIGLLIIAAYFGVIGGLDIYQAKQTIPYSETQFVGGIINAVIGGYVCLCVGLGFLKLGLIAYLFTFVAFIVTLANGLFKLIAFIIDWVHWGRGLSDGTIEFQWVMVTSSLTQLFTIGVVFGFANLFWSAACVFKAGGNGCEFKTYKQIEAGKGKAAKTLDEEV
ncbi:uncharacterized protein LOC34622418 [Cyclospora cayetanensis]|uniref:Uncharacterized protein n=2 Tax=Cyclospora cayetanensis TaxID=88456 RepID=A0A1D3CST8_9EIME|nr:uncharacterized protein LOC34622418 [Cyclospora cayetanensis]OEH74267.1 hypothetical protein cyc_06195 [Cyclospora cayetanensis]